MGVSIAGYASTSDTLLSFRTAYLRLIANAWNDKSGVRNFLEKFGGTEDKNGAYTTKNILDNPVFQQLLPGCDQDSKRPLPTLPWTAHVKVKFDPANGPKWDPGVTAGWSGPNDRFEISLPPAPTNKADYTQALADYFQQFPTLLGHKKESSKEVDGSASEFIEFGNVMMQAIAQSWSKEMFNGIIPKKPGKTHTFRELLLANGIDTLSYFYGYNNPWNFDITFKEATGVSWKKGQWIGELANSIILTMPNIPDANTENNKRNDVVRPIALATYNANGAHYPFTCP